MESLKSGDKPVVLTDKEIIRLVESTGLRNGILKDNVIEQIKIINRRSTDQTIPIEKKITRNVEVLLQLASQPCPSQKILESERAYIDQIKTLDDKNARDISLESSAKFIGVILAYGFDIQFKNEININWTTGKITYIGPLSEKSDWLGCEDIPIGMDRDTCLITGKYSDKKQERIISNNEAKQIVNEMKKIGIKNKFFIDKLTQYISGQKTIVSSKELLDNISDPCNIEKYLQSDNLVGDYPKDKKDDNYKQNIEIFKIRVNSSASMTAKSITLGEYPQELYIANGKVDKTRYKCIYESPYKDLLNLVEHTEIKNYLIKNRILKELFILNKQNPISFDSIIKKIDESSTFKNQINKINEKIDSVDKEKEKYNSENVLNKKFIDEYGIILLSKRIAKAIVNNYSIYKDDDELNEMIFLQDENTTSTSRIALTHPSDFSGIAGKRKTRRHKVSKRKTLRGGKVFAGNQGCVTVPSLVYNCLTRSRNGMRVTKLFFNEADYVEEKANNDRILQEVDPQGEFTSVKYDESPIDLTKLQQDEIAACGKNRPYSTLKHLNYKYLGDSIQTIVFKDLIDKNSSKDMIQALANLAPKIQEMNAKGFYHNDLHFANITYLPSEKRVYLIDFGKFGQLIGPKPSDLFGVMKAMQTLANMIQHNVNIPQPMKDSAGKFVGTVGNVISQFDNSPTYTKELEDLIMKTITDFATEYTSL